MKNKIIDLDENSFLNQLSFILKQLKNQLKHLSFDKMDRDDEEETTNQTINSDKIKQIRKILETHFNEEINYKKL